jgi:hypothetical protein
MTQSFQIPYELRIAVTGHRTLADEAAVAHGIDTMLDRIAGTLAATSSAPLSWTIVSPLARGADQLTAHALLQRLNARLEVVTPFPLDEYRKDFSQGDELAQFEQLLARAAVVDEIEFSGESETRDAAYLKVGERVVETSEILLAIWNGRRAAGAGGTAEIIEYALKRERVVLWIDAEHPENPPQRIRAIEYPHDAADEAAVISAAPFPQAPKELSRGYELQSAYFNDSSIEEADHRREVQQMTERLGTAAAQAGLSPTALGGILKFIAPQFARADLLALRYFARHRSCISGVPYLAALAVTLSAGQLLFFPEQLWLIVFEVLVMLAVLGLWASANTSGWHEKWLHARQLAEQLRIAMFTTLLEPHSLKSEHADPLPFYRGPQQWLSGAVHTIVAEAGRTISQMPLEPLKTFVVQAWLEDQRRFHARNAKRKAASSRRRHHIGFALFGATLLMALLHLAGVGHGYETAAPILQPSVWITFLALVLPAWAGAVHAVTSQLELERIADRSGRMATALERFAHRAVRAKTVAELRQTAHETAELMMIENHEWWVLLSFQGARLHV